MDLTVMNADGLRRYGFAGNFIKPFLPVAQAILMAQGLSGLCGEMKAITIVVIPGKQALNFPAAKQVAVIGKQFLTDQQWNEWVPNGNVISGVGEGESLKTAVTTKSGDMALVYFSNNSACRVKNILNKEADAFWFNPVNGKKEKATSFKDKEARDMVPPTNWEDAILVLQVVK